MSAGLAASGDVNRPLPATIREQSDILGRVGGGIFLGDLTADETGANIAAGFTGQNWGATASEGEASNAQVAQGANALRNTEFRLTAGYWFQQGTASGISTSYGASASGLRRAVQTAPSVANNQNVVLTGGGSNRLPVAPGDRVELSAHIAATGFTSGQVLAFWYNSSGGFLSASSAASGDLTGYDGANGLDDYVRIGGFVTAPAGAGACVISLRATNTSGGTLTDPVAYFAQPLVRVADAVQAQLSPYTPGFEAELAADITGNEIAAGFLGQANGATKSFYQQASAPAAVDGTWWADTSAGELKVRLGGAWQVIANFNTAGSFVASKSTDPSWTGAAGASRITNSVAITPSGGTSPYSYAWQIIAITKTVSGSDSLNDRTVTANSPTSDTTSFTCDQVGENEVITATALCTVSDDNGAIAQIAVTVTFTEI